MAGLRRLIRGHILGCIDAHGAVHSAFTGERMGHHSDHFPMQTHRLWRWNHDKSIHWLTDERKLDLEETEAVRRHLSRKYGLRWWDNGFHDIDHLLGRKRDPDLGRKAARHNKL